MRPQRFNKPHIAEELTIKMLPPAKTTIQKNIYYTIRPIKTLVTHTFKPPTEREIPLDHMMKDKMRSHHPHQDYMKRQEHPHHYHMLATFKKTIGTSCLNSSTRGLCNVESKPPS